MNYYKQGTRIKLNQPPELDGVTGTIVGRTTEYQPVIGATYIIMPDENYRTKSHHYPYDFFGCHECCFDVLGTLEDKTLDYIILDYLKNNGGNKTIEQIKKYLSKRPNSHPSYHSITNIVWKLHDQGKIKIESGKISIK